MHLWNGARWTANLGLRTIIIIIISFCSGKIKKIHRRKAISQSQSQSQLSVLVFLCDCCLFTLTTALPRRQLTVYGFDTVYCTDCFCRLRWQPREHAEGWLRCPDGAQLTGTLKLHTQSPGCIKQGHVSSWWKVGDDIFDAWVGGETSKDTNHRQWLLSLMLRRRPRNFTARVIERRFHLTCYMPSHAVMYCSIVASRWVLQFFN